jgi:hypothetical protein
MEHKLKTKCKPDGGTSWFCTCGAWKPGPAPFSKAPIQTVFNYINRAHAEHVEATKEPK